MLEVLETRCTLVLNNFGISPFFSETLRPWHHRAAQLRTTEPGRAAGMEAEGRKPFQCSICPAREQTTTLREQPATYAGVSRHDGRLPGGQVCVMKTDTFLTRREFPLMLGLSIFVLEVVSVV